MNKRVQWLSVVCVSLAMTGCMTLQPLPVDSKHLSSALNAGDKVEVVTTKGQQLEFAVEKIDEQGVHGGGQHVAYGDIRSISRKQISAGRTALVVLGVVAAGALAAGGGGGGGSSY